jgi:plastocyanin
MSRQSLKLVLAALLVVAGVFIVTIDGGAIAAAEPGLTEVKIDNFTMAPQTITVAAGSAVRWTNADDIPHTVVSEDHAFKSKVMDTNDQFTYTFPTAGSYKYFCSIHPKMTGTVVVK